MKKFKSLRRAIKRGHLTVEIDNLTKQPVVYRNINKHKRLPYNIQ
jgi:hypothetical protein